MCIIVYKPADVRLDRKTLYECWTGNPCGAGFMYAKDERLIVEKGFMSFRKFYKAYKSALKGSARGSNVILHFRLATHGHVNAANTHPFYVNENLAVVHNGILNNVHIPKSSDMSDTFHFTEQILSKLPDGFLNNSGIVSLIEDFINGDKLAFMDNKGKVDIINPHLGVWDMDCWFSNHGYVSIASYFRQNHHFQFEDFEDSPHGWPAYLKGTAFDPTA